MHEYVVVEYQKAKRSAAQHRPALTSTDQHSTAQRSTPSTCRSGYDLEEGCMYEHACCCVRFVFLEHGSSWHLQVACLHLKCSTIYLLPGKSVPTHSSLRASVAGGTVCSYAKVPCITNIRIRPFLKFFFFRFKMGSFCLSCL